MSPFRAAARPLPILVSGDALLRERSVEVETIDSALIERASGLISTLRDFRDRNGFGRAISAPQVGWMQRVVAMNLGADPFLLVNPLIVWRSEETDTVWDDCLSVPGVLVRVRRHRSVSLTYRDHRFRLRRWNRLPFDLAELVQHEIDHLDGVLMTDLAEGPDALQPLSRWPELVGAARPKSRFSLENIIEAATRIDPVFIGSPQYNCEPLSSELGVQLTLKVETTNPVRNFRGRGASYFLHKSLEADPGKGRGFACVSAGNFGEALAYAGGARGVRVTVFTTTNADSFKVARMRQLGAEVRLCGVDFNETKSIGLEWARGVGACFVVDGREPWISEGAGTVGRELLSRDEAFDAVLVPLGRGGLLNGVARWLKAAAPATQVFGVGAVAAPAMERSWRQGPGPPVVETLTADPIADGVAVRTPIPKAVGDMHGLVDDVILVDDSRILEAVRLIRQHTGLIVEPAGALGIAAIRNEPARFEGLAVAAILSDGNLSEASGQAPKLLV